MRVKRVWTSMFGKPERLYEEHYQDEYGRWERNYKRADGTEMSIIPDPLSLFVTKQQCKECMDFWKSMTKRGYKQPKRTHKTKK